MAETLTPVRPLRIGSYRCPKDRTELEWETFGGMLLYFEFADQSLYHAHCPKCGRHYDVRRAWTTGTPDHG